MILGVTANHAHPWPGMTPTLAMAFPIVVATIPRTNV
jgi:hypothetical protein